MRDAGKLNLNSPTPIRRKTEPYARQVLYSDRRFGKLGDMSSSSPFLQVVVHPRPLDVTVLFAEKGGEMGVSTPRRRMSFNGLLDTQDSGTE